MDDLKRSRLVLDCAGRDLVGFPVSAGNREWWWFTSDGAQVAKVGTLTPLGNGRYRFDGIALDARHHTGRQGTEADLLAEIGADLGWRMPV